MCCTYTEASEKEEEEEGGGGGGLRGLEIQLSSIYGEQQLVSYNNSFSM